MGRSVRLSVAAGTALLALAGAASAGENKAPKGMPTTTGLIEGPAARYVNLRADIAHIEAMEMKSATQMREAHNRLGSFDPAEMTSAWVAYAALVAADTPAFSRAIERETVKQKDRKIFLSELQANPAMVRDLDGADEAIAAIRAVAARDATRINRLGDRFIADAYRMQNAGWAKKKIPQDGTARLNAATAWGQSRSWTLTELPTKQPTKAGNVRPHLDRDEMWSPAWYAENAPASEADKTGALMTKALLLAVRYATGDLTEGQVKAYATSKPSNRCYVNAKLNLDQCIAATRTPYEEAFCLGEHALNDISHCVGWVANAGRKKD